jgi:hypothetical protein
MKNIITKDEYCKISSKRGLPFRCPVLNNCMRRANTILFFSYYDKIGIKDPIAYLISAGELTNDFRNNYLPETCEASSCSKSKDVFYFNNVCPEVNLFDDTHAPPFAQGIACISGSHIDRTTKLNKFRHYSECPEYCANQNIR